MKFDQEIAREQVASVYRLGKTTVALTLVLAPVIASRLWVRHPEEQAQLAIWCTAIMLLSVIRLVAASRYLAASVESKDRPVWLYSLYLMNFLTGCAWGALMLPWLELSNAGRVVIYSVLTAIPALALLPQTSIFMCYLLYVAPIFACMAVAVLTKTVDFPVELGMLLVGYAFALFVAAVRLRDNFAMLVRARYEVAEGQLATARAQAKNQFLTHMSHELRTPVSGIIGMSEMMGEMDLAEPAPRYSRRIGSTARELLGMIDDVLDYASMEAGRASQQLQSVRVRDVLDTALARQALRIRETGIAFESRCADSVPEWLMIDQRRFSHVLSHLVDNARKSTRAGAIRVSIESCPASGETDDAAPHGWLRISVADSGAGIAPERVESVFEPFTQANSSLSRDFGGIGLGLTFAREWAQQQGGRIQLTSTLGQGTCVRIEVPLVEGSSAEQAPKAELEGLEGRVLLVEDNPVNAEVANAMLSSFGLSVVHAENGAIALTELGKQRFDLVLMDCQMPVMDGLDATRRIRASEHAAIPVIALTAHALSESRAECFAAGMDGFLSKPVIREAVYEYLHRWLPTKRSLGVVHAT